MNIWRIATLLICLTGGLLACQTAEPPPVWMVTATATLWPTPTLKSEAAVLPLETPIETPVPTTTTSISATQPPTSTPNTDSRWQTLSAGLEKRVIPIMQGGTANQIETVYILRLDPALYQLKVGYAPGDPKLLSAWQEESGAQIVLNGGFFTKEQTASAIVITNSLTEGVSYSGFGGMVGYDGQGVDITSLSQQPYTGQEGYQEALQSFPMLVLPGGQIGFPADQETGRVARRTVIGKDINGRILLIVTPQGIFTLHQLSKYLVESDLQLDVALNLDGGPSTGILLTNEDGTSEGYAAFTALPLVLLFYPK